MEVLRILAKDAGIKADVMVATARAMDSGRALTPILKQDLIDFYITVSFGSVIQMLLKDRQTE